MPTPSADPSRVQRQFARHRHTYADQAVVQTRMAGRLVELIQRWAPGESAAILELGCGSGTLTRLLLQHLPCESLWINDLVPSAERLTRLSPCITFFGGDAECLDLPPAAQDLVASNAMFQWLSSPAAALSACARWLKPGGRLAFTTFGPDHFKQLRALTHSGLTYAALETWMQLASEQFEILHSREEHLDLHFADFSSLARHLRATGVNALSPRLLTRTAWAKMAQAYADRFTQAPGLALTYHPLYLILRRR